MQNFIVNSFLNGRLSFDKLKAPTKISRFLILNYYDNFFDIPKSIFQNRDKLLNYQNNINRSQRNSPKQ